MANFLDNKWDFVVFSPSIRRSKSKNENKPYVKSKSQSLTFTLEKNRSVAPFGFV
jgi:hypothetical protein